MITLILYTPSRAGINVSAATTVTATTIAAAIPTPSKKLIPTVSKPSRATQTVLPANRTALPAVLIAFTADSSGLRPAIKPER